MDQGPLGKSFHSRGSWGCFVLHLPKEGILHRQEKALSQRQPMMAWLEPSLDTSH